MQMTELPCLCIVCFTVTTEIVCLNEYEGQPTLCAACIYRLIPQDMLGLGRKLREA